MKCTYNIDGFCTNGQCPYRACPVEEDDSICKFREEQHD